MPELIFFQALLSGSLRIFSFGDERLRRWAECIHKLCIGALYQPLSGCIRLLFPGALDPVCDPAILTPLPPSSPLSLCCRLSSTCPIRRSFSGPPASRSAGRGRGPWHGHGNLCRTQPPCHEQRHPSRGQDSGVELYPASFQALQLA